MRIWPEPGDMGIVIKMRFQVAYFTLFSGSAAEVPIQGLDDNTHWPQAIVYIWEDLPVMHKLQHGTFPLSISTIQMEIK